MPPYIPAAIALPCLQIPYLKSFLLEATEEFILLKTNLTGGRENVVISIEEWNIEDLYQVKPDSDFALPVQIKVEFLDDELNWKGEKKRVNMGIVLLGLESFTINPSNMMTYQFFKVEMMPYANSDKRDYKTIRLDLLAYLSSYKLSSVYQ